MRRVLPILRAVPPVYRRQFHLSSALRRPDQTRKPDEPPKEDRFAEAMDDRTDVLLKSLEDNNPGRLTNLGASAGSGDASNESSSDKPAREEGPPSEDSTEAVPVDEELVAPRMHHFDTQKVYANLKYAGYTRAQSDVIMSTIRDMVDDVVNTTNERAVPDSAGANEAYLFDAASSELRDEIRNERVNQTTQYRAGLARLQRDVEILQHATNEMTSSLKSDLDMEIHERKNVARAEENNISLRLQELTNKITVRVNSDLKSEIEQLRWQITRRGIVAIVVVAAAILFATSQSKQEEAARKAIRRDDMANSEYTVPILSPSITSEDPEEPPIEELEVPGASSPNS